MGSSRSPDFLMLAPLVACVGVVMCMARRREWTKSSSRIRVSSDGVKGLLGGTPRGISLDIGGSLAKVLVIEELQSPQQNSDTGGSPPSLVTEERTQKHRANSTIREVLEDATISTSAVIKAYNSSGDVSTDSGDVAMRHYVDLAVKVAELGSTLHFVSFETRHIDECLLFVHSVVQDIEAAAAGDAGTTGKHGINAGLLDVANGGGAGIEQDNLHHLAGGLGVSGVEATGDHRFGGLSRKMSFHGDDDEDDSGGGVDVGGGGGDGGDGDDDEDRKKSVIRATGGGAYQYAARFDALGITVDRRDEIACLVNGCNFFMKYVDNELFTVTTNLRSLADTPSADMELQRHYLPRGGNVFPYLLVNIGSGVSIVEVRGPTDFARISGSSIGGSTLVGLASLFMHVNSFDEVMECTSKGRIANVDMLVGDIYTEDYAGLDKDVIASTFGKVAVRRRKGAHHASGSFVGALKAAIQGTARLWLKVAIETPLLGRMLTSLGVRYDDVSYPLARLDKIGKGDTPTSADYALSLLRMISNNIAQIAHMCATHKGIDRVLFTGNFVHGAHAQARATLMQGMDFWSAGTMKAHFMAHDGFAGALGAHLCGTPFSLKMLGNLYHRETDNLHPELKKP